MKSMYVGISKAKYVNDRGVVFTAEKHEKAWCFEGMMYETPFEAFKDAERRDYGIQK